MIVDDDNGLPAFPVTTAIHGVWADMPDLEALFGEEGGAILLKASQTNVDAASTIDPKATLRQFPDYRFDHDEDDQFSAGTLGAHADTGDGNGDGIKDDATNVANAADDPAATPDRDPAVNDLSITEIMWVLNTANVGSGNEHNHQWIEIHNRLNAPIPVVGLVLEFGSGRPVLSDADDDIVEADAAAGKLTTTWGELKSQD